jgi:hypothetical protein
MLPRSRATPHPELSLFGMAQSELETVPLHLTDGADGLRLAGEPACPWPQKKSLSDSVSSSSEQAANSCQSISAGVDGAGWSRS